MELAAKCIAKTPRAPRIIGEAWRANAATPK